MGKAKNALSKTKKEGLRELVEKYTVELGKALPSHMNAERIVRIALTTMNLNPKLYGCEPMSFLGALFQSAQLGLEPNVEGQAYIIPYGKKAQFQIGYKGYVELFYRHESALSLQMETVCENDNFKFDLGNNSIEHTYDLKKERGDAYAYYAKAYLKGGAFVLKVMTKDECLKHGKQHSKTFGNGPWKTDRDAMCKKTVLIQLMKLLPKSIEIQKAVAMDETIKSKIKPDMFGVPDETDYEEAKDVEAEVEEKEKEKPEEEEERSEIDKEYEGMFDGQDEK